MSQAADHGEERSLGRTMSHAAGYAASARYVRRRRARRASARAVALLALVAILGTLAVVLAVTDGTPGKGEAAESTPRSEWRLGEVPYLYQTDPAWAQESYAGAFARATSSRGRKGLVT